MPLPHRRQRVARFIRSHDLTYEAVANAVGIGQVRFANLVNGHTYPSPRELDAISKFFFDMPPQALFEEAMLEHQHSWPPKPGPRPGRKAGESDA